MSDRSTSASPVALIRGAAEPLGSIDDCDFGPLLGRIGEALIRERGFDFIAVEPDWPDATRIDDYVTRRQSREGPAWEAWRSSTDPEGHPESTPD